jgi:hypothetical protein
MAQARLNGGRDMIAAMAIGCALTGLMPANVDP